jgi:uncharacterized repeat protein (TIGR03803 family)
MAGRVTAQTFRTLHGFAGGTNGCYAVAGLVLSSNALYGTARFGGIFDRGAEGMLFKVNTDGMGFTILHSFAPFSGTDPYTNSEGANPIAGLILSGRTLYGTAYGGGSSGAGTVFAVNTDGTDFTTLHSFAATSSGFPPKNSEGAHPSARLTLSNNTLFGTAPQGGTSGFGTVFKVKTDSTDFANLYSFSGGSDGATPVAELNLSGDTLYGTTSYGGVSGVGTVFKVNTDGTGFASLHSFTAGSGDYPVYNNSDGAYPQSGLILSGNTLYGTALTGGGSAAGTVFAVNTDSTAFRTLHIFNGSDAFDLWAGLTLSGNTLYGTARFGGSSRFGFGTLFALNTDGTGFTNLYNFTDITATNNSDGASPVAGLILSGGTLYGTAAGGGSYGWGTVFSLSLRSVSATQLSIIPSGTNVILKWPTNATGFTLQSTTNLVSSVGWTTVSPVPVSTTARTP